jgi:hypothetical protein
MRHIPPKRQLTFNGLHVYISGDRTLHNYPCENLKSYNSVKLLGIFNEQKGTDPKMGTSVMLAMTKEADGHIRRCLLRHLSTAGLLFCGEGRMSNTFCVSVPAIQ